MKITIILPIVQNMNWSSIEVTRSLSPERLIRTEYGVVSIMKTDWPIKSVKTTFDITESLVELNGAGVSELANHLDIAKSTVHDHLTTLERRGFVTKNEEAYHISYRFLELGERRRHRESLINTAAPELEKLAEETGEYVSLVIEEGGEAVIIDTKRGDHAVNVTVYNGVRMKMHSVAAGKAILSHYSNKRIKQILDSHGLPARTKNTITTRNPLYEELDEIHQQGYALDDEERIEGMRSVASPIIDRYGDVHGSITVYGPTQRIGDERFEETLPEKLLETSNIIEVTINYE